MPGCLKRTMLILCMLVIVGTSAAAAQERQQLSGRDWSASLGANVWFSKGEIEWEHEVPIGDGVFIGSKLHWKDIETPIYSLDADFVWRRFVVTAAAGWGTVESGEFIDDDFIAGGPLLSRTRSPVDDGSVYYGNVALGWRAVEWRDFENRRGHLDVLAGYQWWREKYEAFGVFTIADSVFLPGGSVPTSVRVITHEWTWHSIRVGGRVYVPLPFGFGARVGAFIIPWSSLRVEDTHHLRDDLRQNPSVLTEATGGFGYQVEAALMYTIWKGLGIEGGYRRWEVSFDEGDAKFREAGGGSPVFDLKDASSKRYGFFVGLYYRF